ncbi:MAG: hypothetical protein K9H64_00660 [Bacteroidales bacterium]|nr:hypothetical protein [Bacteroidales bacterium]MCF8457584.1 hypothetical protein [Bacteroidales bacterium]
MKRIYLIVTMLALSQICNPQLLKNFSTNDALNSYGVEIGIISKDLGYNTFTQTNTKIVTNQSQTLILLSGWNLISTYIDPIYPAVDSVFQPILSNLLIMKDYLGQPYWPQFNVNLIGNLTIGQGYQVKMASVDTLTITGDLVVPENNPVLLQINWNIIGYLRTDPAPPDTMLYSIQSNLSILKDNFGNVYWPQFGVNLITEMQPGQGYQLKLFGPDTLLYPPNDVPYVFACGDVICDFDGNSYNTVLIGNQCWMKQNMRASHYDDGTALSYVATNADWVTLNYSSKAFCYYNNDSANGDYYGALYTWAAAMKGSAASNTVPSGVQGICPTGWHVPSDEEWRILEGEVDSQYSYPDPIWGNVGFRGSNAGNNLKATFGWYNNGNGSDLYGFTALPSGHRYNTGDFQLVLNQSAWWSSHCNSGSTNAWSRELLYNYNNIDRANWNKRYGMAVRCLKDN